MQEPHSTPLPAKLEPLRQERSSWDSPLPTLIVISAIITAVLWFAT